MDASFAGGPQRPVSVSATNPNDRRGWLISIALHAAVAAVIALLVATPRLPQVDTPPTRIAILPPSVVKPEREPPRREEPDRTVPPVDNQQETADETRPMTDPVIPETEHPDADPATHESSVPFSDPDPSPVNGSAFTMAAIGGGGGGTQGGGIAGAGRGRPNGPHPGGKTPVAAMRATAAALRWFVRHQSPDGRWDVDGYAANCSSGGPRCEPGTLHTGPAGDIACSALALLCFLGNGHDGVSPTAHRRVVARGLRWLADQQAADGTFGTRNYEQAIATMALCDALAMAGGRLDAAYREPARKGIAVLIKRQNPDPDGKRRSGWDYAAANAHRDDSSVTGWAVMALKSAFLAGLDTGRSLAGARGWLERSWRIANPAPASLAGGGFPYMVDPVAGTAERNHLVGLGACCAAFLGVKRGEPVLETLVDRIVAVDLPALRTWPCNTYLLYYDTMAMFQATADERSTDPRWSSWHPAITGMLVNAQRADAGCFDGSWDFQGTKFHGHETGRLLSTALCCLSLEVQERFAIVTRRH